MNFTLRRSINPNKKFDMFFEDGKKVSFGMAGSEDFTISKDEEKKRLYLLRHAPRERWNDIRTAGALARWLLWNKTTLEKSIKDTEKRFGIKIRYEK